LLTDALAHSHSVSMEIASHLEKCCRWSRGMPTVKHMRSKSTASRSGIWGLLAALMAGGLVAAFYRAANVRSGNSPIFSGF
jgi:hypothetical protein